jgi:lauroyl/myristoyl acyltransferase
VGDPAALARRLEAVGGLLSGWNVLGREVFAIVQHELPRVLLPMGAVLLVCLRLAFGRWGDVALGMLSLAVSGLLLHAVMLQLGWSWNLMNLMALPLLLGMGVDFSIHMILALRREAGDGRKVRRTVGRALLLAGATTMAGFAALSFASNAGLASLGRVCAAGIACALVTAVGFLPAWWMALWGGRRDSVEVSSGAVRGPSSLYRAGGWRLALALARVLPAFLMESAARVGAAFYRVLQRRRWRVVVANLAPFYPGDPAGARRAARALFGNFAGKLVDLWRYEAGHPVQPLLAGLSGWEHFEAARARGRGVLLVTVHVGNWELGAPLMIERGVALQVVTQAEPDPRLTALREEARMRRGVSTLPLTGDPFAAVEIVRRLAANQAVALLLDRPPAATAVTARLAGRPFAASAAAADLARATGCAIVPVCVPRVGRGYAVCALPEIAYDRASLRDPAARLDLTQRILDALEPLIARHASQWYHFVPIWPEAPAAAPGQVD